MRGPQMAPGAGLHRGFCFGGLGSPTPRFAGVQGLAPVIRRALRDRRLACACANNRLCAALADAHAAAQGGQGGKERRESDAPHPAEAPGPARLAAYWPARAGGALRKPPQTGATCPDGTAQAEGSRWPTTLQGPAATEHLRSDRHGPTGFARLAQPPA